MNDHHLLWLDLETTGTDETKDSIIEIGCVLTDADLNEIGTFTMYVEPTDEALGRLLRNEVVREMHAANGLLDLIADPDGAAVRPHEAASELLGWLDSHSVGKVAIAGSGVAHFDRRFLDRGTTVEAADPDTAHRLMEQHYSDRHAARIAQIVGSL